MKFNLYSVSCNLSEMGTVDRLVLRTANRTAPNGGPLSVWILGPRTVLYQFWCGTVRSAVRGQILKTVRSQYFVMTLKSKKFYLIDFPANKSSRMRVPPYSLS